MTHRLAFFDQLRLGAQCPDKMSITFNQRNEGGPFFACSVDGHRRLVLFLLVAILDDRPACVAPPGAIVQVLLATEIPACNRNQLFTDEGIERTIGRWSPGDRAMQPGRKPSTRRERIRQESRSIRYRPAPSAARKRAAGKAAKHPFRRMPAGSAGWRNRLAASRAACHPRTSLRPAARKCNRQSRHTNASRDIHAAASQLRLDLAKVGFWNFQYLGNPCLAHIMQEIMSDRAQADNDTERDIFKMGSRARSCARMEQLKTSVNDGHCHILAAIISLRLLRP